MKRDKIGGDLFASVWDALEDSPAEAANMRMRSELMIAVQQTVADWGLIQTRSRPAPRRDAAAIERPVARPYWQV